MANVGYDISDQTVGNILKEHGVEPAPDRKRQTTWKTFIKSHWDVLAAIDFTTIEVWTKGGLVSSRRRDQRARRSSLSRGIRFESPPIRLFRVGTLSYLD